MRQLLIILAVVVLAPARAWCQDDPQRGSLGMFVEVADGSASPEDVRQAVSRHLGVAVAVASSTAVAQGTRGTLHVRIAAGGSVRMAFHRADDTTIERVMSIDGDDDGLHVVALMAENLVRDQVSDLLDGGLAGSGGPEAEEPAVASGEVGEPPAPSQPEGDEPAPRPGSAVSDEGSVPRQRSAEPSPVRRNLELTALVGSSLGVLGWRVEAQASYRSAGLGVGLSAVRSQPVSNATADGSRLALAVVGDYRVELGDLSTDVGVALGVAKYVLDDGAITQAHLQGRIVVTGGLQLTGWLALVVRADLTAGLVSLDQAETGSSESGSTSPAETAPLETAAVLGLRGAVL